MERLVRAIGGYIGGVVAVPSSSPVQSFQAAYVDLIKWKGWFRRFCPFSRENCSLVNAAPFGSRLYINSWHGSYAGKIGNERYRRPASFHSLSIAFRGGEKCGKVCRKACSQRFSLRPFRRRSLPSERLPVLPSGVPWKGSCDGVARAVRSRDGSGSAVRKTAPDSVPFPCSRGSPGWLRNVAEGPPFGRRPRSAGRPTGLPGRIEKIILRRRRRYVEVLP